MRQPDYQPIAAAESYCPKRETETVCCYILDPSNRIVQGIGISRCEEDVSEHDRQDTLRATNSQRRLLAFPRAC